MEFVKTNHLIVDTDVKEKENVVVVDILKKMNKDTVEALPKTVELIITMSAGLDHIDLDACEARGEFIVEESYFPRHLVITYYHILSSSRSCKALSSRTLEGMPSPLMSSSTVSVSSSLVCATLLTSSAYPSHPVDGTSIGTAKANL